MAQSRRAAKRYIEEDKARQVRLRHRNQLIFAKAAEQREIDAVVASLRLERNQRHTETDLDDDIVEEVGLIRDTRDFMDVYDGIVPNTVVAVQVTNTATGTTLNC